MKPNLSLNINKVNEQKEVDEQVNQLEAEMNDSNQAPEQKLLNIIMVDLNNRETKLKMINTELILELREYLHEYVYTCFFTNYYLEHNGQRLSDYSDLSELDLDADPKIYMRAQLYDEKTARQHIKRVTDILTSPCVLNSQQKNDEAEEKLQSLQSSALPEAEMAQAQQEIMKEIQAKQNEKQRKNYEQFLKLIEKDKGKEYMLPNKKQVNTDSEIEGAQKSLYQLSNSTIQQQMNANQQYAKCLEGITFSGFNPVPPNRRLAGDLFYLNVKTLDVGDRGITCCVNGFYVNNNVEKGTFNPNPSQRKSQVTGKTNSAFSYTLIGCLNQISPAFGKNLEKYINQIVGTEQYFLNQPNLKVHHWANFDQKKQAECSQHDLSEVVNPLYGLDPRGIRDWNEEFQVVKDFPRDNLAQRAQKDRALHKIYNDFLEAATQGAIAIIKGNLSALNPNEAKKQQVFVYNYIFFSFTVDLMDCFKDLTSTDNNPSWTQANHDLTGLRSLQFLEIEGLHYLATTIVNYRGHRIIAQSIIPGILNNSELASLAEYGTVDEQQTIQSNPQFHEMMLQVCQKMNIQVNKIIDGEGKEVEIAGCIEVKGIRGTDKRCYIVDLQGMTPRDANFLGEQNHTCLVRQELLVLYQRHLAIEYAKKGIEAFEVEIEKERKEREIKVEEGKEATEEQKKAMLELRKELNLKKVMKFEALVKEKEPVIFNTNVFKTAKLAMTESEIKAEEDKVKSLADYLKETAIPNLIKNLQKNEGSPTDSQTLKDFFHQNGVNIRYLGQIADIIKEQDLTYIKYMLEREVLVRCIKHIFGKYIRDCESDELIAATIAHLFNLILAPREFIKRLDDGSVFCKVETLKQKADLSLLDDKRKLEGPTAAAEAIAEEQEKHSKKDKKRQRQNPKKEGEDAENEDAEDIKDLLFQANLEHPVFEISELFLEPQIALSVCQSSGLAVLDMTPKQLYTEIRKLAEARYKFTCLPKKMHQLKVLESSMNKMSLLRDICLSLGIQLNLKHDYILENDTEKVKQLISQELMKDKSQGQNKKKGNTKAAQVTNLSDAEIFTYANLPFQPESIADFYPILKHLNMQNKDATILMQQARQSQADGQLEQAFELYSQAINILLQVSGPINSEVASCISKMANIQYKFGDYLQAIELQTKSIIIQEKLLGYDNATVAYSYSNLGLYYHTCQYFSKGFEYMNRSLQILEVVCGQNHPDITSIYLNLGMMYQDVENFTAAIDCYMESLYRNINLYGDKHIQVASCYQAIAHAYYMREDFRMALDYQEKSHLIIKELMPAESEYVIQSERQLHQFMSLSVQQEKYKNAEKGSRAIGENKAKMTPEEKEEMHKRQQIEQYIKRLASQDSTLMTGQTGQKFGTTMLSKMTQNNKAGFYEMLEQKFKAQQVQDILNAAKVGDESSKQGDEHVPLKNKKKKNKK